MVWQYSVNESNKYGNKAQAYRLVTLGADGLVVVWTWHKLQQALYAYKLSWPQPGSSQKVLHGGSCLSLLGGLQQRLDSGTATFMVGTEGGKVGGQMVGRRRPPEGPPKGGGAWADGQAEQGGAEAPTTPNNC